MFLQLHLHIFHNVIQSTYISKCDLQFCKSRQCFVLKQVQYYKYCFCIFILSFLIFWGQGFVEVPQLLKSVSSFTYRIVNRILRFVSRYVSNRGIVYRYTPNHYGRSHLCKPKTCRHGALWEMVNEESKTLNIEE